MAKVPRKDHLPALIKIANAFGGHARYSSSQGGAFVRIGYPPNHVDIHKGDSIIKKGSMAIVTRFYIKQKLAYLQKHPELRGLVNDTEKLLKAQVKFK